MKKTGTAVAVMVAVVGTAMGTDLADMVVTPSRDARESWQIPASVEVITAEDIEGNGFEDVVDALKSAAGVSFRSSSGNASQGEISMRGFGENSHGRVLVLLDGAKLNRPDMAGIDWAQIPLANVERIEIVRGGNSVLYGDHAVAGVINIITKKGTEAGPAVNASVSLGSFRMDTEKIGVAGKINDLSYALNIERQDTRGYRDRSGYSTFGIGGNLGYRLTDDVDATLALSYNALAYELPGWLTLAEMTADRTQSTFPDDEAQNDCVNADLGTTIRLGKAGRLKAHVVYGSRDIASDMASWFSYTDLGIDTFAFTPQYMLDADLFGHANRFLAGADYCVDRLSVRRFADLARTMRTTDATLRKTTFGLYLKDEFNVTDSFMVDIGGRMETADIDADVSDMTGQLFDDTKSHTENALGISGIYVFGNGSKCFARFGTVYRYPFVDEQVAYFGYGADQLYAGIEAETGENYELGADLRLRENIRVGLTAFLQNMKDEIAYNAIVMQNENLDGTRRYGVEAMMSFEPVDCLALDADYTFTRAYFIEGANDGGIVPLVPEHSASVGAQVVLPFGVQVRAEARYVDAGFLGGDNGNTLARLPSYTVTDVSVRFEPAGMEGCEFYVAMDNVFDEEYTEVAYMGWSANGYYPSPGRAVRGGVSYRF